jgi:hypothetical protein
MKKKDDFEVEDDDLDDDYSDEEEDSEFENEVLDDNKEIIDSSLEIGGQIHTQSDIITKHPHLPKDVKYSNFGKIDIANFMLKSNAYQLWQYTKKIEKISKLEIDNLKEVKKQLYYVENLEELKKYLEDNKKGHIWHNLINNFNQEDLKKEFEILKIQLKEVLENGVVDYIYSERETFNEAFLEFQNIKKLNEDIDDFGLVNTMMSLTEVNKARKGWATGMMNTTISVTKEEDLSKDTEEQPEDSERGVVKKLFRK